MRLSENPKICYNEYYTRSKKNYKLILIKIMFNPERRFEESFEPKIELKQPEQEEIKEDKVELEKEIGKTEVQYKEKILIPEKEGAEYLDKKKKGLYKKVKDVFEIVKPHANWDEMVYKIVGPIVMFSGGFSIYKALEIQMPSLSTNVALGLYGAAGVGVGSIFLYRGIREAIENIRAKKEVEKEMRERFGEK
jgi:hypothetical protein